jgi:hypothetical protein
MTSGLSPLILGIVTCAATAASGLRSAPLAGTSGQDGRSSLVFSTYFGGGGETRGASVAVDRDGAVYMTGRTATRGFPRVRPTQARHGGGENDAFVTKLTSDGQQIVYSTFLGGSQVDFGERIVVDGAGNAYIAGTTYSSNFPTTSRAVQRRYGGGDRDCFVAKLDPGGRLLYSTLLGGNRTDRCTTIAVDEAGNAYVAGSTDSPEAARTAFASGHAGRDTDVLFAKLDPSGSRLLRLSRFGSTHPTTSEAANSLALAADGTVYIAGSTDSADFPVTGGAQPHLAGQADGFIVRLATSGAIVAGTFVGGGGSDGISGLALGPAGAVTVTGTTRAVDHPSESSFHRRPTSNDFPVRRALQPAWTAFLTSAFVTKLEGSLAEVLYSTYLSGTAWESASDIAVDADGNAHVVGTADSKDLALVSPIQRATPNDRMSNSDLFVVKIRADGASIELATYLGGRASDNGAGIAVDGLGNIVVIGSTGWFSKDHGPTDDFPTARPFQSTRESFPQAVVAKIALR